jgi:hypothetical protein
MPATVLTRNPVADNLMVRPETQEDIVEQVSPSGPFTYKEYAKKPIGGAKLFTASPLDEDLVSSVIKNHLKSRNLLQNFTVRLGEYASKDLTKNTRRVKGLISRGREEIADVLARELNRDETIVAITLSVGEGVGDSIMEITSLKSGTRVDEKHLSKLDPVFRMGYLSLTS